MSKEDLAMVRMGSDTATAPCSKIAGSCRCPELRERGSREDGVGVDEDDVVHEDSVDWGNPDEREVARRGGAAVSDGVAGAGDELEHNSQRDKDKIASATHLRRRRRRAHKKPLLPKLAVGTEVEVATTVPSCRNRCQRRQRRA